MTAERRGELAVAIWLSLLNHIQNKHCGHSKEYANCEHGDLLPRKWIFPGTDAFDKLRGIVENNRLLLDIKQVSPSFQTSSLESFHSVLNRFAPKSFTFSFHGMLARYESYVGLLLEIVNEVLDSGSFGDSHVTTLPTPPPLTSSFGPVDKAALVRGHLSRKSSSLDDENEDDDGEDMANHVQAQQTN
ncbi:uncharacterized protein LOC125944391 [Dermacentor silvarum]|uniref:uncharacterized protein LOC125944391 n=1 Tax=Dermacentor silvarum TaxID=543639 RepID=UPI0021008F05|nr:uncharacterized protein LOC125944391 [Dermacentor silvarum]